LKPLFNKFIIEREREEGGKRERERERERSIMYHQKAMLEI